MAKVNVLYNYIPKVQNAITGELLAKALMAGGQVIEANAKINVARVFSSKSTGGAGLGGSITTELVEKSETSAKVHVGPSKVYGAIQEFGGTVKPLHAKMLSWVNEDGERIFAFAVHLPARPYLRPAVDEHKSEIEQAIGYQVKMAIEGAL
jgi:HK97 gp10 family phage protein